MATYLIEARMRAPIIAELPGLHLESILAAAVYLQTGLKHEAAADKTGIRKSIVAGFSLYHASSCFIPPATKRSKVSVIRRRSRNEMGPEFYAGTPTKSTKKHPWSVDQGIDPYRALMVEYDALEATSCYWLVETDDPERILELLDAPELSGIGKRTGQGWGQIASVHYRELPAGTSAVLDEAGFPRRVMPLPVYTEMTRGLPALPLEEAPLCLMLRNYTVSGWENPPLLCVAPVAVLDPQSLLAERVNDEVFFG